MKQCARYIQALVAIHNYIIWHERDADFYRNTTPKIDPSELIVPNEEAYEGRPTYEKLFGTYYANATFADEDDDTTY